MFSLYVNVLLARTKIKLFVRKNVDLNLRIKFSGKKFQTKHLQCQQLELTKPHGELITITYIELSHF